MREPSTQDIRATFLDGPVLTDGVEKGLALIGEQ